MSYKVAINGFGRIGRNFFRCSQEQSDFQIVAINDITSAATLAHLLRYDSVFGRFNKKVEHTSDSIIVDGREIKVFSQKDPKNLPWASLGVDLVVESTGVFKKHSEAQWHMDAGAKKVIFSAPADDPDLTVVMGVNHQQYHHEKHHVLSNASCTTNCVAPVAKVLHDHFTIVQGNMTTIHSYTNDQRILDLPHKDLRRARSAAINIIPTTTGAAKAIGLVVPELKGKISGSSVRVPTANGSLVDLVVQLQKPVTAELVKNALKSAAENEFKGIIEYSQDPLVSTDIIGNSHSAIVDSEFITVISESMVKILAWYDNEWGYSCRVRDLIALMIKEG